MASSSSSSSSSSAAASFSTHTTTSSSGSSHIITIPKEILSQIDHEQDPELMEKRKKVNEPENLEKIAKLVSELLVFIYLSIYIYLYLLFIYT
jgi:hypothetical protein